MKPTNKGGFKTKAQMAEEYGICLKTFSKLLKEHGINIRRHLITPKEQEDIYSVLGSPEEYDKSGRFRGKV